MPQRFVQQIVFAVLALVAMGSDAAWADKFQRGAPPRSAAPRSIPQRIEPQRVDPPGMDQQRFGNEPQMVDPRDGGLPASVRRIQRETGGQVLKAQPIQRDGRQMYRVKVLTPQGRIRVVEDMPPMPRSDSPPSNPPNYHHPD